MTTETNPYQAPQSNVEKPNLQGSGQTQRYMGFWPRVAASVVDNILMILVTMPLLYLAYGQRYFVSDQMSQGPLDIFVSYILPDILIIMFWTYNQATPGKMMFNAKIVDAKTGEKPSQGQWIIRYLGYIPSALVFGLGFLWVAWDKRKQGWHDKMAGTVVVYPN
jgi:uncharacterized RDD family membrane protein YckC